MTRDTRVSRKAKGLMGMKNWEFRNYKGQDGTEKRELYITGEIAEYSWWGDETTPDEFEKELYGGKGDVDMWISSPGGDVFAAARIYNSITQYKGGKVTAYVYGLCASAATVVTMAASEILMSPTALMLIHNPSTIVWGDRDDMKRTAEQLDVVKETIINAYVEKTGLSRKELSEYMNREKAFDAMEAIDLGFADGLIESEQDKFSTMAVMTNSAMVRFYNSVRDWKLAFQAKAETDKGKQEEESMANEMRKPDVVVDVVPTVEEVKSDDHDHTAAVVEDKGTFVDVKDFEAVVNELKAYKEQSEKEIADLRKYKARQEAELKAKDLIGLPGITDERRVELAMTADEKLFEELKAMATAMQELAKPVGVTVTDEDAVLDNKEETELRKKIKDYAAEHGCSEKDAYLAVVNGGK